jgi:hypothetical protein
VAANLAAPTLSTPGKGATGISTQPTFTWSQVSGNVGYRIIVSTNPNDLPTDPSQSGGTPSDGFNMTLSQNTTSYAWSGMLSAGTTYYWEVHALGSTAGGTWSNRNTFTITSNSMCTRGQQFTYNQEGGFCAAPYHPTSASGVTIGVGYDMSQRSAASIVSDLVAAGVDKNTATKLSQAAGLTGTAADAFVRNNGTLTITLAEGNALFLAVYSAEAQYACSVATSSAVVKLYGATNWDTLNQKIKDILIDMTYRGDYTPSARTLIQKYVVNNDLAGFTKAMSIAANWPDVPSPRFYGRIAYLQG